MGIHLDFQCDYWGWLFLQLKANKNVIYTVKMKSGESFSEMSAISIYYVIPLVRPY